MTCPWERTGRSGSAVGSCLGWASFHRLVINAPASRRLSGAGAPGQPAPRARDPRAAHCPCRVPASPQLRRPLPAVPPGSSPRSARAPLCVRRLGNRRFPGAGTREDPPTAVARPRAGCCLAETEGPGSCGQGRPQGGGSRPGGAEQRGGHGWRREGVGVPPAARPGRRCHGWGRAPRAVRAGAGAQPGHGRGIPSEGGAGNGGRRPRRSLPGAVLRPGPPRKPRPAALSLTAPGRRSSFGEAVAAPGLGRVGPPACR